MGDWKIIVFLFNLNEIPHHKPSYWHQRHQHCQATQEQLGISVQTKKNIRRIGFVVGVYGYGIPTFCRSQLNR